ncbi:MAG: hypothetical protein AAB250_17060 [Bdellovibrionota bacterium]
MLKSAAAFAFAVIALSTVPGQAQTGFSIYPDYPVYCEKHDYPRVNQVSKVMKVSETQDKAIFTFKTATGACVEGKYVLRSEIGNALAQTLRNKLIVFGKEGVKSKIEVISVSEAQITLAFDKKVTFKKRDVATFTMMFYPNYIQPVLRVDAWGRSYYQQFANSYYPWQVKVTKLGDSSSDLEVGVMR